MTPLVVRRVRAGFLAVVVLVAAVIVVTGRSSGGASRHYSALFADASELVGRNDVRVDDVKVGQVTSIRLDGLAARVSFTVAPDVHLGRGTTAEIRQVSLLGEQYVALTPTGPGTLPDRATIPEARTSRSTDFESLVAVGGDLTAQLSAAQLNSISGAFNQAFGGDPQRLGDLIDSTAAATSVFVSKQAQLNAAIDQVQRLAATLAPSDATLATSIDQLDAGMRAVAANAPNLGTAIGGLASFSAQIARLLSANEARLERGTPQLAQVLGEISGSLGDVDAALRSLYGFNAAWSCIGDGNFLNVTFVLLPVVARMDYGTGACNPEQGQRSRNRDTGFVIRGVPAVQTSSLAGFLSTTARAGQ